VIVKQAEAETQTKSGLILADTAKEKPQKGTVIAVGEGKLNEQGERIPVDVKTGDTVIYSKYGGTEVKVEGEEYLILRADDIYAVVA
jgi:chaperonin GroES